MTAADFPNHAGNGIRMSAPIQCNARIVEVDTLEGRGKKVRVAFTADLAVRDDVETGIFLRFDRDEGRVILGFGQVGLRHPPQLPRTHSRRKAAGETLAVNQPFRLRIAADQCCWKQHRRPPRPSSLKFRIPKSMSVYETIVDSDRMDRQVKGRELEVPRPSIAGRIHRHPTEHQLGERAEVDANHGIARACRRPTAAGRQTSCKTGAELAHLDGRPLRCRAFTCDVDRLLARVTGE